MLRKLLQTFYLNVILHKYIFTENIFIRKIIFDSLQLNVIFFYGNDYVFITLLFKLACLKGQQLVFLLSMKRLLFMLKASFLILILKYIRIQQVLALN